MFIKVKDNQIIKYPYTIKELKEDNPNVSFLDDIPVDLITLKKYDTYSVTLTDKPLCNIYQHVLEKDPVVDNDCYKQVWEIVELSQDEIVSIKDQLISFVDTTANTIINNIVTDKGFTSLSDIDLDNEEFSDIKSAYTKVITIADSIKAAIPNDNIGVVTEGAIVEYFKTAELISYVP
jgi:hypothetical protein